MALSVSPTAPLSSQPTYVNNTRQINNHPGSARAEPILRNQIVSPDQALKRKWQKEAMASFSAGMPNRSKNPSPEVQHARKLLKIAKQQEAAGIHFDGQLTIEQAKACLSFAKKEDTSVYQQFSDAAADALNLFTNVFSPADKTDLTWLEEFETAVAPYFTIHKSPLCKPGSPPSLIVIGDGNHASSEVQIRLTEMVQYLQKKNAMTTLIVEHPDPPSLNQCRGLSLSSIFGNSIRCIGGDDPVLRAQTRSLIKMMAQSAFQLAGELYQFAKARGIDAEHINPDKLAYRVDSLNYVDVHNLFTQELLPLYSALHSSIEKDGRANLKISDLLMDYRVAFNDFSQTAKTTLVTRSAHLMQTLEKEMASGHTAVAVFGDAHVQYNANELLQNYDCWILDDKSSDYVFSAPEKT